MSPRSRYKLWPVTAIVLGLIGTPSCRRPGPGAVPPLPEVNGQHALELAAKLVQIGPRPAGSTGAAAAVAFIVEQCRGLGYACSVDTWEETTATGPKTFRNVRAAKPGSARGWVLVGSHLDTKVLPGQPGFVGANDSASSTALVLELMRVLATVEPWAGRSLEFMFFDGEECVVSYGPTDGFHGSRRQALALRAGKRVAEYRAMVLLDMVGDRDLTLTLPVDTNPQLARRLFAIADQQGVRDRVTYLLTGTLGDDHTAFQQAGIPAIDLIDFSYGPNHGYWHTTEDTIDKLSAGSLQLVGRLALQLIAELAYGP